MNDILQHLVDKADWLTLSLFTAYWIRFEVWQYSHNEKHKQIERKLKHA